MQEKNMGHICPIGRSGVKTALGLPKYSRNTSILRALHIKKIREILEERHLSLTRAALHNTAKSRPFYLHIMNKCQYFHMNKHSNLLQRAKLYVILMV